MHWKIFAIILFVLITAMTGALWAQNPDITAQTGHNRGIFDVVFSADSRLLVSYAGSEIILWDVNSGPQIRTMNGHEAGIKISLFLQTGNTSSHVVGIKQLKSGMYHPALSYAP